MATVNHITDQFLSTNNVVVSALTFSTVISSLSSGNSTQWNQAYNVATTYQSTSSSFATNTTLNSVSSFIMDYINKNFIQLINPQP